MKVLTGITQISLSALDEFIFNHPHSNFFQSTRAFYFFQSVENYEPIFIIALERGEIVGSVLAVIIKEGKGLKGYLSRRLVVWGGPLIRDENPVVYSKILDKIDEIAKHKAIYSQFRNFFELNNFKEKFKEHGWRLEDHLNILLDLTKSQEVLWKEVHSKRRNEIRRAEKEGTSFKVLENRDELKVTYKILKEVYDRAKLPLPDQKFFKTAYRMLAPDYFRIFLAVNDNNVIGTMYVLCFRDVMYDWYAGSQQSFYKKYPNDLIPWKAFLWSQKNGFKKFDFGGAGKPDKAYGVRDYKQKFGGDFVNYGRFEKIHKPFLFQIGRLGFKIWQKLK